jgi:hypothetical protein
MIDHKPYSDFKNHLIFWKDTRATQDELLALFILGDPVQQVRFFFIIIIISFFWDRYLGSIWDLEI